MFTRRRCVVGGYVWTVLPWCARRRYLLALISRGCIATVHRARGYEVLVTVVTSSLSISLSLTGSVRYVEGAKTRLWCVLILVRSRRWNFGRLFSRNIYDDEKGNRTERS